MRSRKGYLASTPWTPATSSWRRCLATGPAGLGVWMGPEGGGGRGVRMGHLGPIGLGVWIGTVSVELVLLNIHVYRCVDV